MMTRLLLVVLWACVCFAGTTRAEPMALRVAVHINDIQQISLKTHSFYADLYIGLRWADATQRPSETLTWMNPYQLWAHITRPMAEEPQALANGDQFEWVRVRGEFNVALPLHDYPLDRQILVAEFEDRSRDRTRLTHVVEQITVASDLSIPGFVVGVPRISALASPGNGAVHALAGTPETSYSRVRIEIPVSRPFVVYLVKLGLPLLLVTACNALSFLLPNTNVEARVGLGITSFLVMVALHIAFNNDLPEVSYLTRLDKLYLVCYLFGFGTLASVSWIARRYANALDSPAARRANNWCCALISGAYVLLSAWIVATDTRLI